MAKATQDFKNGLLIPENRDYLSAGHCTFLGNWCNLRCLTPAPLSSNGSIQTSFLEQIRQALPHSVSFADELAEVLNLSRDSAYRRMRGETVLSLDEIKTLCDHYKVSLDELLSPAAERVSFQLRTLNLESFSLEKWMRSILANLETMNNFNAPDKEVVYDAKDLPIFYNFQFPRLAAFKLYFWGRFFSQEKKFSSGNYNRDIVGNELTSLGEKVWECYSKIPSTEIIRPEMLTVTLHQIEYLHECELFDDKEEARQLCDDCSQLITRLKDQAQLGLKKVTPDANVAGVRFNLYHNDLLHGDNTILFKMGDKRVSFVTSNTFNIMTTTQPSFCKLTEDHMNNLIRKSIQISATGEKERSKFFNKVEEGVRLVREAVS